MIKRAIIVGFTAFAGMQIVRRVGPKMRRQMQHKMREHCKQMAEQCRQMATQSERRSNAVAPT